MPSGAAGMRRWVGVSHELDVVAFDGQQAAIARDAFRRLGKGKHRANLNFGDCAVYALAATDLPLSMPDNGSQERS
jgi:ribonuclease VapC